ncbi:MAG: DUF4411 family protein [Bacteroidetes bacterium]|nr:DUF4411 family protein [Bacteroidota bacterium]
MDTNVFINAKNLYYQFDFHPGFWDWLLISNIQGRIFSIKEVYDEICKGDDTLTEWARKNKEHFFLNNPPNLEIHLNLISEYVAQQGFKPNDIRDFISAADYYLIGYAMAKNFKVVTLETHRQTGAKIKIPKVCEEFNVECITPFEMLRLGNARFILDLEK